MPTGLLGEYARPLVPLAYFDGTLADSTRTNASLFRALYVTAASACIYGPNPLPTLPAFNQRVQAAEAASESIIPVMVERLDYASVRADAFSQNLLSLQNGQVYDVPGRAQSPYQTRTLFAAAPSRKVARTGNVTLVLLGTANAALLQGQIQQQGDGVVRLATLLARYERFRDDAGTTGLVTVSNRQPERANGLKNR